MRYLSIRLLGFIVSLCLSCLAQASDKIWTPYQQNSLCLLSENFFEQSGTVVMALPYHSDGAMILAWHIYGKQFVSNLHYLDFEKFSDCFNGEKSCGLPTNLNIAQELKAKRRVFTPDTETFRYFQSPPPKSAIRFAMSEIGDCFGDVAENISFEDAGIAQLTLPMEICTLAGDTLRWGKRSRVKGPDITDEQLKMYQDWGQNVYNLTNNRKYSPNPRPEVCELVPAELVTSFKNYYDSQGYALKETDAYKREQQKIANEAAEKAARYEAREFARIRESRRETLLARNEKERFGNLDGCQIAYSYVINGINRSKYSWIEGHIPEDAISWAVKAENAVQNAQACPLMPEALSRWVEAQDTKLFEAYGADIEFRESKPITMGDDELQRFAQQWMWRNFTFSEANYSEGSNCLAIVWFAQNGAWEWAKMTQAQQDFYVLARKFKEWNAPGKYLCTVLPPESLEVSRNAWQSFHNRKMREQARQEAEWSEANIRKAARRAEIDSYYDELFNWKPPYQKQTTLRCYDVENTKYGTRQHCFNN